MKWLRIKHNESAAYPRIVHLVLLFIDNTKCLKGVNWLLNVTCVLDSRILNVQTTVKQLTAENRRR